MAKTGIKRLYQQELKRIISALKAYQPEKIILFGSGAKGKFRSGSDVDLLVIKDTNEPYWERQIKATLMYPGWIPTDILVLTPQELEKAKRENRFFLTEEILPHGKVVYKRSLKTSSSS